MSDGRVIPGPSSGGAQQGERPGARQGDGGHGLAGLSVRRPLLATVFNLLIVLAGAAALFGVDIRELPDVDRPIVMVRANYPGASPATVDAEATALVEAAVARVNGIVSLQSSSEEGNFRVRIEFRPDRDLIAAANDVREAVSRVERRLPEGVEDVTVVKAEQDAQPVLEVAVASTGGGIDALTRRVEDQIVPELTAVDGVAEVTVNGERERVLRVAVQPERLAAFGLSIAEVAEVLSAAQFDVPVGSFSADSLEVLVRADATVAEPDQIAALMVRDPVRLGDVADVYFAPDTAESYARLDGRMVINLGVVRQAGANTVRISADVARALDRLRVQFPELRFSVVSDDAVFIEGAVEEVLKTLLISLVIVVGVIWLFIGRLGATLIPAAAIPVALIGSLAAIWLLGFSVNLVTLLALVLATGIVVDDAIVVLENIQRKRSEGLGARAAAVIGAREVFFAVIATTATLVAVFVPISFLPSAAGRLFTEFGYLLAISVVLSSFVALTLAPMLASRLGDLGSADGDAEGPVARLGGALGGVYAALLRRVLAAPLVALTACGIAAGAAGLLYGSLGQELTPPEDRGAVTVFTEGPDGAALAHTDMQVAAVEAMFEPWVEQGVGEGVYSVSGRWDLNRGSIGMRLAPWEDRTVSQAEIEAALRPQLEAMPGVRARIRRDNSLGLRGSATGGGLSLALTGAQYETIAAAAYEFADRLEEIPGLSSARVQYQATQPQLSIAIDRARAADLGVPMTALSTTLRALIDEDEVAELTVGDQTVPILLHSRQGSVRDPADLLNLYVRSESGALIPLSQLVSLSETGVAAELDRQGQRRAVQIDLSRAPELSLSDAVAQARAVARDTLPGGIGLQLLGEAATLEETANDMVATYVIAILVVFLVLVAQFESVTSALVVMLTVPFGVCAAILALWLSGGTVNIFSQIGVLMLIGILAKNGILMVEFADQLRDRGASVRAAAFEAARIRLRPIAMTLTSTVLAGLPLILGGGPGAEARAAIGWVIFGGLGLAALFTLFLTPAAYVLIAGWSRARAAGGADLEQELDDAMARSRTLPQIRPDRPIVAAAE